MAAWLKKAGSLFTLSCCFIARCKSWCELIRHLRLQAQKAQPQNFLFEHSVPDTQVPPVAGFPGRMVVEQQKTGSCSMAYHECSCQPLRCKFCDRLVRPAWICWRRLALLLEYPRLESNFASSFYVPRWPPTSRVAAFLHDRPSSVRSTIRRAASGQCLISHALHHEYYNLNTLQKAVSDCST